MRAAPPKHILGILLAECSGWSTPLGDPLSRVLGELTQDQRIEGLSPMARRVVPYVSFKV